MKVTEKLQLEAKKLKIQKEVGTLVNRSKCQALATAEIYLTVYRKRPLKAPYRGFYFGSQTKEILQTSKGHEDKCIHYRLLLSIQGDKAQLRRTGARTIS